MTAVRRFARVGGQVVKAMVPAVASPIKARPLDHLADQPAPDLERDGRWRAPWPMVAEEPIALRNKGAKARADLLACAAEWTFA
jgi:hypothetical protein